jgi:hypothetical protein
MTIRQLINIGSPGGIDATETPAFVHRLEDRLARPLLATYAVVVLTFAVRQYKKRLA